MFSKIICIAILTLTPLQSEGQERNVCSQIEFKCGAGNCISNDFRCDGNGECADGSDEKNCPKTRDSIGTCTLPAYPENGKYKVKFHQNAKPRGALDFVVLKVSCEKGYGVEGSVYVSCNKGTWLEQMPKCNPLCYLPSHASVEYRCLLDSNSEDTRPCNKFEPNGTLVSPKCRSPNYYIPTALTYMRCNGGDWNYIAKCVADCGTLVSEGTQLIINGQTAKRGEVPWHAAIYTKKTWPYQQICGGSLISNNIVVSAAHCFWNEFTGKQPAANYAVAVGKLYRPWANPMDNSQWSNIQELHIPSYFHGSETNFQFDIAVLIMERPFEYRTHVRPVCVDFDDVFMRRQLQHGKMGKKEGNKSCLQNLQYTQLLTNLQQRCRVWAHWNGLYEQIIHRSVVAGWGLIDTNGTASQVLKVIDLPYVSIETCISKSPPDSRGYINGDKICAGFVNESKALCRGDSGGGLAFPGVDRGTERYFLRGIVSTAATSGDDGCNANIYTSFTQVQNYENFIKQFWVEDVSDPSDASRRQKFPTRKAQHQGCGWCNPDGLQDTRDDKTKQAVARDGEAKFAEFPWVCSILKIESDRELIEELYVFVGGGTLIHRSVVLTAAHCTTANKLRVRAGDWDRKSIEEPLPYQEREVSHVVVHPDYENVYLHSDVALLFLSQPMELSPNVNVACLPPPGLVVAAGTLCLITGWGKDSRDSVSYKTILKKIEVPVVDRETCQKQLRTTQLGDEFELDHNAMCAGQRVPQRDACKGDGGAPLSCPIKSQPTRYMVSGITSWGVECGKNDTASVYADVAALRGWIDSKLAARGLDANGYSF